MLDLNLFSIYIALAIGISLVLFFVKRELKIISYIATVLGHILFLTLLYSNVPNVDLYIISPFMLSLVLQRHQVRLLLLQNIVFGISTFVLVVNGALSSSVILFALIGLLFFVHYWAHGKKESITTYLYINIIFYTLFFLNTLVFGDLVITSSQMLNEKYFDLLSTLYLLIPMFFMTMIYFDRKESMKSSSICFFAILLMICDRYYIRIGEVTNNLNNTMKDQIFLTIAFLIFLYLIYLFIIKRQLGLKNHQLIIGIVTTLLVCISEEKALLIAGMTSWMIILNVSLKHHWINFVGNIIPIVVIKFCLLNFSVLAQLDQFQKSYIFTALISLFIAFLINEKTLLSDNKRAIIAKI